VFDLEAGVDLHEHQEILAGLVEDSTLAAPRYPLTSAMATAAVAKLLYRQGAKAVGCR
jgi:hypothetical protein